MLSVVVLSGGCTLGEPPSFEDGGAVSVDTVHGGLSVRVLEATLNGAVHQVRLWLGNDRGDAVAGPLRDTIGVPVVLTAGDLDAGIWTVRVEAIDTAGLTVRCGGATAFVSAGAVTDVQVELLPALECALVETHCGDGLDGDLDGRVDCADTDCADRLCDDGLVCTSVDHCVGGTCVGAPIDCAHPSCGDLSACDPVAPVADAGGGDWDAGSGGGAADAGGPDSGPVAPPTTAEQNCSDGKDDDLDGLTDCADWDCLGTPCDDGDPCTVAVCNPTFGCIPQPGTAVELCNGVDDDCDGETDENAADCTTWHRDQDEDGWGSDTDTICTCQPEAPYTEPLGGDCDDSDGSVNPTALETCATLVDDDCDGSLQGTEGCSYFYLDLDEDGFGAPAGQCLCVAEAPFLATKGGDCNDLDDTVRPGATDACDGLDNDCDGATDEDSSQAGAPCDSPDDADECEDDVLVCTPSGVLCPDVPGTPDCSSGGGGGIINECLLPGGCANPICTGATCDDGSACTTGDTCLAGQCVGATASCDDGSMCTVDVCDSSTGCVHVAALGLGCDDGLNCTLDDSCTLNGCQGVQMDCDDGDPCTSDACTEAFGCAYASNDAGPCDDGDACTTGDVCQGASGCQGTGALSCDDGDPCTADACDPSSGCVFEASAGAPCDDGDACTVDDICTLGLGCVGMGETCDDGNVCTDDSCDPTSGCTFVPNNAPCEDGDACTTATACDAGTCVATAVVECVDDGNPCTLDVCDPVDGTCGEPVEDLTACAGATDAGVCVAGHCYAALSGCVDGCGTDGAGPEMVIVPGGPFWRGCTPAEDQACTPDEAPSKAISLTEYAIDRVPATVQDFIGCTLAGACEPPSSDDGCGFVDIDNQLPMDCLDRTRAAALCQYMGKQLCTEAQWERAARGPCPASGSCSADARIYPWGDDPPNCTRTVWSDPLSGAGCGAGKAQTVGTHPFGSSPEGVLDLAGNVAEWVLDAYDGGYYASAPLADPLRAWAAGDTQGVVRGGHWASMGPNDPSGIDTLRVSARQPADPTLEGEPHGVRCCVIVDDVVGDDGAGG